MVGLNTVFKQVFGEGLKEEGFVKIKGRQPYLVRVVEGGEIIHVITCREKWLGEPGFKAFQILGSVETVYSAAFIDFMKSPTQNINWLETLSDIYYITDIVNSNKEYYKKISKFIYRSDDEESMKNTMREALEETKKVMLKVFDEMKNMENSIDYFRRYATSAVETLLYIKANNHDDFIEICENEILDEIRAVENGNSISNIEVMRKDKEHWRLDMITRRDKIYNNSEEYDKALVKLEQRKAENTQILSSLGLL